MQINRDGRLFRRDSPAEVNAAMLEFLESL